MGVTPARPIKARAATVKRLDAPLRSTLTDLARAHLAAAAHARARLQDPGDREALHDFRVALRRLRSLLRAYRPYADWVPKKLRRRLRRLVQATNPARDAEVQIAWLTRARLPADARSAGAWLGRYLRRRRDAAYRALPAEAAAPFDRLYPALRKVLAAAATARIADVDFSDATARALTHHATTLARAVAAMRNVSDVEALHAARIEGKRLRYLIEPLQSVLPQAHALVRQMQAIQDHFGDLHDLFVLLHTLECAAGEQAADTARRRVRHAWRDAPERGIGLDLAATAWVTLAHVIHGRAAQQYAQLQRDYSKVRIAEVVASVNDIAQALGRPQPRKVARRPAPPASKRRLPMGDPRR